MKNPALASKDLLSITDFSKNEILSLFDFSLKLKKETKQGKTHTFLKGKTLAMIFEKSSTRTRVSFETGVFQLGGHALFLSKDDIQIGRGETIADTARVLSRYVDGIMLRTFSHDKAVQLARNATIPVINGLSDTYHPCQALADFLTILEFNGTLKKVKLAYVGDGNNVAHSLMLGAALLGIDFAIACPKAYSPDKKIIEYAFQLSSISGSKMVITTDVNMAVENANFLYTDVWTSMGREKEAARRRKAFAKYRITGNLVNKCAENCKIMHCLPAHRGEEIDEDVMESERSIIFDQAENRLHVQKAIMCALMK